MEIIVPISVKLTPESQALIDALNAMGKAAPAPTQTDAPLKIGDHHFKLGGKYAGISVGEDGQPDHPLALLSHKADKPMTWDEATKWAASFGDGSRLPTKREAALLYANLPDEFDKSDWHWTSTPYSASLAWLQFFGYGGQSDTTKSSERLCRAVRLIQLSA